MSTSSATQTRPVVIDLTGDDMEIQYRRLTEEERRTERYERSQSFSRARVEENRRGVSRIETIEDRRRSVVNEISRLHSGRTRGPRFGRDIIDEDTDPPVIDLVESDTPEELEPETTMEFEEDLFGDPIDRSSPDVTFLSERPAPGGQNERTPPRIDHRRLPTPRRSNFLSGLRELVSYNGNYRAMSGSDIDEVREALVRENLDRVDGIPQQNRRQAQEQRDRNFQPFGQFPIIPPPRTDSTGIPEYIDVNDADIQMDLDYEATGFAVEDPDNLEIIDPPPFWPPHNARRGGTPHEQVKEPYTKPKPCMKGFTMNFDEDDCLECPSCHDELAMGEEGSAKAQVWMVKTCGHVSFLPPTPSMIVS